MYNHEPQNYECPFCQLILGETTQYNSPQDIVYETDDVIAYVSPKWWPNNPGNILVIPKKHVENIYDISEDELVKIYAVVKRIALGIRETYDCTGTSTRQHNEPDGGQDVWHLHVQVFPRYKDDKLYQNQDKAKYITPEDKQKYVSKLKDYFSNNS